MSSINRMAPRAKGDKYDRATLIKIKTFVFNILLDKLNLLYIKDINLFDSFKFIIENNNPNKYIKIIS